MSDPYFDNVSLLIPFEYSTAIPQDYSPNKKQLITGGVATPDDQDSKFYGKSVSFDGRTGYIVIPPSQDFNFGTGDYTIEFWVKVIAHTTTDISTSYPRLISQASTLNVSGGFQIWIKRGLGGTGATRPDWAIEHATSQGPEIVTGTNASLNDGQWHHVAFAREAGSSRCFLDGVVASSTTDTTDYHRMGTDGIIIGSRSDFSQSAFSSGNLQDLRITKGVCRYTGNFTPPDRFLSDTNLSGTVLTTEGLPKPGMTVRCIDRNPKIQRMWTTKTDKFGHYSFLLPKGDYTILAQDDNGNLNDQVKRVRN